MQGRSSIAGYFRSHFSQQRDQIRDLWLACGIFQNRFAVGERCSHQNILRAGHGNFFEHDVSALEPAASRRTSLDVTVGGGDFRAHFLQRAPMAHPPGSETRASPVRASVGPRVRMEARMVLTSSYGATASLMVCA